MVDSRERRLKPTEPIHRWMAYHLIEHSFNDSATVTVSQSTIDQILAITTPIKV